MLHSWNVMVTLMEQQYIITSPLAWSSQKKIVVRLKVPQFTSASGTLTPVSVEIIATHVVNSV